MVIFRIWIAILLVNHWSYRKSVIPATRWSSTILAVIAVSASSTIHTIVTSSRSRTVDTVPAVTWSARIGASITIRWSWRSDTILSLNDSTWYNLFKISSLFIKIKRKIITHTYNAINITPSIAMKFIIDFSNKKLFIENFNQAAINHSIPNYLQTVLIYSKVFLFLFNQYIPLIQKITFTYPSENHFKLLLCQKTSG